LRTNIILHRRTFSELAQLVRKPIYCDVTVLEAQKKTDSAIDALGALHVAGHRKPILIVSSQASAKSSMSSFIGGASSYFQYPRDEAELHRTIAALGGRPDPRRSGDTEPSLIELRSEPGRYWLAGRELLLTDNETTILNLLLKRIGTPTPRAMLYRAVYGASAQTDPAIINVFVSKLRKKLAAYGAQGSIETKRGKGFILRGAARGETSHAWVLVGSAEAEPPAAQFRTAFGATALDAIEPLLSLKADRILSKRPHAALGPNQEYALSPLERRLWTVLLAHEGRWISSREIQVNLYGDGGLRGHKAVTFHIMNVRR
jgi:DNA-binding response OmpR family regulator